MVKRQAVTIQFPAPLPAEIPCPICEGNKCKVCDKTGKLKLVVDAKVPIQRNLIVKYVSNNLEQIASELSRNYGLVPEVNTEEIFECDEKRQYEIVKISSLGGVIWIASRLDDLESPRYFTTRKELTRFKEGWFT
tara:strand:+ start:76 stop:480 length:405 start_codon:yes stop_codon:yes gene_type:complete